MPSCHLRRLFLQWLRGINDRQIYNHLKPHTSIAISETFIDMAYSQDQLRRIFQGKFDQEAWEAIIKGIFRARIRSTPEKFSSSDDPEDGYFFGFSETPDSYRIGYFYYRIRSGSVAHKKVGLRNLVKRFINQTWGEFDAAIVVFDDGREWRLSFVCDIREEATAPKRFTFVFGEHDNFYRTAIERLTTLQGQEPTFGNIRKAFSVEVLSDDFFDTYREIYADFVQYITGKRYVKEGGKWVEREFGNPNFQLTTTFDGDAKLVRDYVKKMFGRIVFLYFLQRKGWLDGNRQYMHDLFHSSSRKDDFLDGVLEPLFFEVLNTDMPYRSENARSIPGSDNIPYLNGGLFAKDDVDPKTCVFPADYFRRLFDFLDSYNFTIDENDTDDAEIGIDPEMLGRIFENLLEDNKDKGAFYTPREIVDYMCRESIIAYLTGGVPERSHAMIRRFVETLDASELNDGQRRYIRRQLQAVRICDPAIGSGAFPMGLLNLLSRLYVAMKSDTDTVKMKRYIMEHNIYGVDIERGAVDIARLRFWLAMIVEEKGPILLPNLHFKIMQGNSLIESYDGTDLADLTKVSSQTSLFDSTDSERKDLVTSLKSFYKTSDHTGRDRLFNDIINNVRRQISDKGIILPSDTDPSANTDFFLWHTWFSDVFANGGFDIVIGNPPYFIYQDTHAGEIKQLRKIEHLKIAFGGKLNAYKLFLASALQILTKTDGVVSFIFQNSFLGDLQAANLRRHVLTKNTILKIDSFPERDSKKKRIFESVKMSVCVVLIKNSPCPPTTKFQVNIWEDRNKRKGMATSFNYRQIMAIDPDGLTIPRLDEANIPLIIKLLKKKEVKIKCIEGELNMTTHRSYFTTDPSLPKILKGASIQRYSYTLNMSQGEIEYLDESRYLREYGTSEKSWHHLSDRIAMQGMSGANDKIRLIMTIVPQGVYLANSCNYILPSKEYNLYALLSILNSKLMNWFFRCFSTNSNVNGYEVDNFPIVKMQESESKKLELQAKRMLGGKKSDNLNAVSQKIDMMIYHLYGLTYEEMLIVDPETCITREDYENFN